MGRESFRKPRMWQVFPKGGGSSASSTFLKRRASHGATMKITKIDTILKNPGEPVDRFIYEYKV